MNRRSLCNSVRQFWLNTSILLAILVVYALQINHLLAQSSTSSLAPYWVVLGAIHANTQLAHALCHLVSSNSGPVLQRILSGQLRGPATLNETFGLIHVAAIWLGSWILVISYLIQPTHDAVNSIFQNKLIQFIGLISQSCVVLGPPLTSSTPSYRSNDGAMLFFSSILACLSTMVLTVSATIMLVTQLLHVRAHSEELDARIALSFGINFFAMASVAIRWFMKLGFPAFWDQIDWSTRPVAIRLLVWWYYELGFWLNVAWVLPINYLLYASFSGILWLVCS